MSDSVTPWSAAWQTSLSSTISWSLFKLMSTESIMLSNYLILCQPLLLLLSVFPSIGVFSNESALCIRWPKYWSFSINPSNEHTGLLFLRLPLRLTGLISLLSKEPQHHNSKASILWFSDFFMVQLSHPYMTTGKNMAFDRNYLLIKYMKFENAGPVTMIEFRLTLFFKKNRSFLFYTPGLFLTKLFQNFFLCIVIMGFHVCCNEP